MAQEHDKNTPAPKGGTSPLDSNAKKPLNRGTTHTDPQDHEEHDGAAPRQPHERDESADSQALANETAAQQGQRGFADATGEQLDTDKGPVVDAVYNQKVVPPHGRI